MIAVLAFVVIYFSLSLVDSYYSKHYKTNNKTKIIRKSHPISNLLEVDKITQFDLIIPKLNVSVPVTAFVVN